MRPLLFALMAMFILAFAPKKSDIPERFVVDGENVFTFEEEDRLDSLFRGHELRTGNEIILVTTYSYNGQPDLRSYAATCGDSLKVGKKRRNNGLVIAFSGHLREVYMAPGLGTEAVLPEWKCQKFADSLMVPLFKESMYFDGIWEGSRAVVNYLEQPGHEIN